MSGYAMPGAPLAAVFPRASEAARRPLAAGTEWAVAHYYVKGKPGLLRIGSHEAVGLASLARDGRFRLSIRTRPSLRTGPFGSVLQDSHFQHRNRRIAPRRGFSSRKQPRADESPLPQLRRSKEARLIIRWQSWAQRTALGVFP